MPHGLVLSQLLFLMFMEPLSDIIIDFNNYGLVIMISCLNVVT